MNKNFTNPIFEKNLQALFQQDEILAARLFSMSGNEKYDVFINKNDPIDINIIDKQTLKYVYDKPAQQTEEMLDKLEKKYKRYPILFFYGLGNGVLYKALLSNETHQKIVVVEPELEIIYIVLNMLDLTKELASERLTLFYSEFANFSQFTVLMTKKEIQSYVKIYDLQIHTSFYDENFTDDIIRINKDFARAITGLVANHGNDITDNLQGIKQDLSNLVDTVTNYSYRALMRKRMKKMENAIIVSTGPSLDKQLPLLKKVVPYATIISVDASYPILLKHGIAPDYVTSIERVPETSTFFLNKDKKIDKDIYFIVATLTHKDTIKNLKNRNLVLTKRPFQDEINQGLKEFGYLGLGHSTANQAYQLAYVLKHKNIILIGQDLAYAKDGRSHATGHAYFEEDKDCLYTTAYGGEGEVKTTIYWNLFKNQFENDINKTKTEDIITYNCTEGGARINGAVERPFAEVVDEIIKNNKGVKNLAKIEKVSYEDANKYLLEAYQFVQKKLELQKEAKKMCEDLFLEIVPKIDMLLAINKDRGISAKEFPKLLQITKKIDKLKDKLSGKKLSKFISNILQISVFYQELELAKIAVEPSDTELEKSKKLLEWVEIHKYWIFSVAGGLDADINTTKKSTKNLVKELKKRKLIS